jgi:hypothetical protein
VRATARVDIPNVAVPGVPSDLSVQKANVSCWGWAAATGALEGDPTVAVVEPDVPVADVVASQQAMLPMVGQGASAYLFHSSPTGATVVCAGS